MEEIINKKNCQKIQKLVNLTDHEIFKTFGTGSFGRVKLSQSKNNGKFFAVKVLKKDELIKGKHVERVLNEIDIFSDLNHPFIVDFEGYSQDERFIYLFMEFVIGGELHKYILNLKKLETTTAAFYAAQIVDVFEHLHDKGIVYRDLKPENVLITIDGYIKLTDFGFAKQITDRTFTLCGTIEYFAPEMVNKSGHNKSLDYWTLGIFIYEMVVGKTPFLDIDPIKIYQNVLKGEINFPKFVDKNTKNIISKLLNKDQSNRLGMQENGVKDIFNHKFFKDIDFQEIRSKSAKAPFLPYVNLLDQTCNFDPVEASPKLVMIPIVPLAQDPFVKKL